MDPRQYEQHYRIESTHWWFRGRREILRAALQQWGTPPRRVLDVGCGVGANLELLAQVYPKSEIVGIDVASSPLRFCREHHANALCQADAAALPYAAGSFDLVAGLDSLEHLPDDAAVLEELFRVCAPGGTLLLTVPAFPSLWGNVDETGHHFRRYRRGPLMGLVHRAGFRVLSARYFNFLLFPPIALVRLLARAAPSLARRADGEPRSDFDLVRDGALNGFLARLFALEAPLLRVAPPFGVSLLCMAQKPAGGS